MDERIKTLAYNLVHFSCKLEKGENTNVEVLERICLKPAAACIRCRW